MESEQDPLRFQNFVELYFRYECQLLGGIISVNEVYLRDHVEKLTDEAFKGFC